MSKTILVTRSSMPEKEEYFHEIEELWDTHWLTNMGVKHKELENRLKDYLKVDNIELLTNGHMALELTLQALGITGEVITTPFTFASTTHAIIRNGLIPVFCDIKPDDFTIDVSKIEKLVTSKTSAIMPVHVYGNICDIEGIDEIAKKYNLKVIYDAAHSFGESYKGRKVGNFGDASCFSFHATKVFNTIEGGAVSFHDEGLGRKLYDLKNFGIHSAEEVVAVGANAKMNEFCASMGICNLRHIDNEIMKRKMVVERYRDRLRDVKGIRLNVIQQYVDSNYSYFPIVVEEEYPIDRDQLFLILNERGIVARKYFCPITSAFQCFTGLYCPEETPVALEISKKVLTLPLYADLSCESVDYICDIIVEEGCK